MVHEYYWLEKKFHDYIIESIRILIKEERFLEVYNVLDSLVTLFGCYGKNKEVDYAITEFNRLLNIITNLIIGYEKKEANFKEILGIIDIVGLIPITLLLEYIQSYKDDKIMEIASEISTLNWNDRRSIYGSDLDAKFLERAEFIQSRLGLEFFVEKKIKSPNWYLEQLIFQEILFDIDTSINELCNLAQELHKISEAWIIGGKPFAAVELNKRALEFIHKFIVHTYILDETTKQINSFRIEKLIPWKEINLKDIIENLSKLDTEINITNAKLIGNIAQQYQNQELPDVLGRTVHVTGERCLLALIENDTETFSILFPHYFEGTFLIRSQLNNNIIDMPERSGLLFMTDPIVDLMTISGYALLFSEIHINKLLWEAVSSLWDRFLDSTPDQIIGVVATHAYNKGQFAISPRSLNRTSWKMAVNRFIESMDREHQFIDNSLSAIPRYRTYVIHTSDLVKVFAGQDNHHIFYDGDDIFIEGWTSESTGYVPM